MGIGRGEKVGDAYVRINYSGEGANLDEEVREDLKRATPQFESMGEEHGESYDKGWSKVMKARDKVTEESLLKAVDRAAGDMDARGEVAGSNWLDGLDESFRSHYGEEIGNRLGAKLRESINDGLDIKGIDKYLRNNLHRMIEESIRDIQRLEEERRQESERSTNEIIRNLDKITDESNRAYDAGVREVEVYRRKQEDLHHTLMSINEEIDKGTLAIDKQAEAHRHNSYEEERSHGWLHKLNNGLDRMALATGSITGRGSRNNFLNFVGVLTERMAKLAFLPFKVAEGIGTIFGKLTQSFKADGISGLLKTAGSMAASAALGIAALAAAVVVLVTILGPAVALLSGLLGILVALSATVIMAAVAGLAALAGSLLPLAAGIGVAIAAFAGLPKAAKDAAGGVLDAVKDLGQKATDGLLFDRTKLADDHDHTVRSFADMMDALQGMVRQLGPITEQVGRAVGDSIDIFLDTLTKGNQGWDRFINAISRDRDKNGLGWLADSVRILGRVFSNTFGGMLGLFRGMMPLVSEFLHWLSRITAEFDAWANSRQGQREIRAFLEDAAGSAHSLGDFLQAAGGFLGDLITQGNEAGDNMFDGMTRSLQRFRDYVSEPIKFTFEEPRGFRDPEGLLPNSTVASVQTRLQGWFDWAQRLGEKIGEITVAFGQMFDDLDTDEARDNLLTVLEVLRDLLGVVDDIVNAVHFLNQFSLAGLLGNVQTTVDNSGSGSGMGGVGLNWLPGRAAVDSQLDDLLRSFNGLGKQVRDRIGNVDISNMITGSNTALVRLLTPFDGSGKKVRDRIGNSDVGDMILGQTSALTSLITPFNGSGEKVRGKIGQVDVGNMISNVIAALTSLINPFDPAGSRVRGAIGQVDVSGIISGADAAAANLVDRFRGLNHIIEGAIGTIVPIFDVRLPSIPHLGPRTASGGVFFGAQQRTIAEDGMEAVVPLERDLTQVDPSVRWLSALAQGKVKFGDGGSTKTVDASGWVITSNTEDSHAVAAEVVNYLAAASF